MTYTVTLTFRPEATTDEGAIKEAQEVADLINCAMDCNCQAETVVRHGTKDQMKEIIFNRLKP